MKKNDKKDVKKDNEKMFPPAQINWYKPTLINFQANLDFIRFSI